MNPPAALQILDRADSLGWEACVSKKRGERSADGQFFTPVPIARFLANWFSDEGLDRTSIHLLDPGAGGGALTAAVVDRITALRLNGRLPRLELVTLEVWELDHAFLPALRKTLAACSEALGRVGIRTRERFELGNYVEGAVRALDSGLFGKREPDTVTHAILNPPYRKISTASRERALLASLGMETSNLYAAFVWLSVRQLGEGGELSAITPRSFCNGPYFREFRRAMVASTAFERIHLFDSRKEAFGRDEVLQENILFKLRCGTDRGEQMVLSTGSLESPVEVRVPYERVVSSKDSDRVIHLATGEDSDAVRTFFDSLPCGLGDLGIDVSTGPVVDFRLKDSLSDRLTEQTVPLIYPHGIRMGIVVPPRARSSDYADARLSKKPVAIRVDDETSRWLVECSRFVLIKRFSSKEEKRRLVAGVLEPDDFPAGLLGLENHVNFFHRQRTGIPASLARGLCRFLNSTAADRFFRQFNGHTQVNVTDLRSFRYPDPKDLEKLGRVRLDDADLNSIDFAMAKVLGAPSVA